MDAYSGGTYFSGRIDEVGHYSQALSTSAIGRFYSMSSPDPGASTLEPAAQADGRITFLINQTE